MDCPDGLARCTDGRLERSKLAATLPGAPCPWAPAGECAGGCVEGVVLPEEHAAQLCRPDAGAWRALRSPAAAGDCGDARFACTGGRVVDCSAPSTPALVGTCAHGCAMDALDDELSDGDALVVMCARKP